MPGQDAFYASLTNRMDTTAGEDWSRQGHAGFSNQRNEFLARVDMKEAG